MRAHARLRRSATVGAAAAATVAFLLITSRLTGKFSTPASASAELSKALAASPARPFVARLSSGQRWRLPKTEAVAPSDKRTRAAASMILAGSDRASPAGRHNYAVAALVNGATARAIDELTSIDASARNGETWNDLATAYIVRVDETNEVALLLDALTAADGALRVRPKFTPALFNRALILDRLGVHLLARRAWSTYLEVERDGAWDEEALRRLSMIGVANQEAEWRSLFPHLRSLRGAGRQRELTAAVTAYPQQARRWTENIVLGSWADATLTEDEPTAQRELEFARQIADIIKRRTGDSMLHEIVDDATRAIRLGEQRTLAEAIRTYRDGRIALSANRAGEAERKLRHAYELLSRQRNPLALTALYYVASALDSQWRIDEASAILDELVRARPEAKGYRAFAAQIGWERGACYLRSGALSNALDAIVTSRDAFASLGEDDFAATMEGSAAVVLDWAGDSNSAWAARVRALRGLSRSGNQQRVLVVLEEAAQTATARHDWNRAETLRSLSCALAEEVRNTAVAAYAWSSRALVATERGDAATARASIAVARRWAVRLTDPRLRTRAAADLAYAEGTMLRESAASEALRKFDEALQLYATTQNRAEMPSIHLARARVEKRLSLLREAERDLDAGLAIVRQERGALRDPERRATLVESANSLFEEAISLNFDTGDHERAFELADEQLGRALADRFLFGADAIRSEAPAIGARAIRDRLAPDAAIVEYVPLPGRLLTFVVRREALHATATPLKPGELTGVLTRFRAAVHSADAGALAICNAAFDLVMAHAKPHLQDVQSLAIVAGERFGNAPFAALYDGRRREFLIQRMNISVAPSAALLVAASERARDRTGMSLLTVGASVFDRQRFPDAETLMDAEEEAKRVAASNRQATILLGDQATKQSVTRLMGWHAIVHFAGHATLAGRGTSAVEPALLLAPSNDDNGELRAGEIASARLHRTRLVLLAACRSAVAPQRNDGTGSLALAFLAAGVPTVVATLADLDDIQSTPLMTAVHRGLVRSNEAFVAVGNMSRQNIDSRNPRFPLTWANFLVIGGASDFISKPEKRTTHENDLLPQPGRISHRNRDSASNLLHEARRLHGARR